MLDGTEASPGALDAPRFHQDRRAFRRRGGGRMARPARAGNALFVTREIAEKARLFNVTPLRKAG